MKRRSLARAGLALLATLAIPLDAFPSEDAAWATLEAGGVMVLRHAATEPGLGDPAGFRLDDCGTQRNLSMAGRAQATTIGQRLAARNVAVGPVLSSRWCRCLDTARLAFGRAEPWPALDSFFGDRSTEPGQTAEVRARIASWREPRTLVLVTHQVNITALTGETPAAGEAVILRPRADGFAVVGRIRL